MAPKAGNGIIPQPLPPSVEEAYRRKCRFLRHRTNEIEEVNDAGRQRLTRLKRQIEKLRLERAFLLEQMAKRTSTNVEDSDGSPSPPPTPKDKPLRMKRGHRKPSATSETPNGATPAPKTNGTAVAINGTINSAFDLYCSENRASVNTEKIPGEVSDELKERWESLDDESRAGFRKRFEILRKDEDDIEVVEKEDTEDEDVGKKEEEEEEEGDYEQSKSEQKGVSEDDEDVEMVDGADDAGSVKEE